MMPLLQGILLGASLCVSLGPQSLFVLRQGIRGEAGCLVALICTLVDFGLIAAAVTGAEIVVDAVPDLQAVTSWAAVAFILAYGCFALWASWRSDAEPGDDATGAVARTMVAVIVAALTLSLLNPQVYMEVMVTVGLVGLHFPYEDRWLFGLGVAAVSPLWFFGLVLGGRRAAQHFGRSGVRRAFDLTTGLAMIGLAVVLLCAELSGS
jgi:L-lysine exporter family protein LysE/ArgO